MNDEEKKNFITIEVIGWLISTVGLGVVLTAYAHTNFASKEEVKSVEDRLKTIDERVYDIHKLYYPKKGKKDD